MKTFATHLVAFILGIIALPLLLFAVVILTPETIPTLVKQVFSAAGNNSRGVEALATADTEEKRFYHLGQAAKEMFNKGQMEEARKYAEELASLTLKYKGNWNYGNAIQDSNVVLGRLAVQSGDLEAAKNYLAEAAKSPGSPQMNSFGPNVSLAKDLLEKGEKESVIAYLTVCKTFWKMHRGRLDDWIASAEKGNIPDFGANLVY